MEPKTKKSGKRKTKNENGYAEKYQ